MHSLTAQLTAQVEIERRNPPLSDRFGDGRLGICMTATGLVLTMVGVPNSFTGLYRLDPLPTYNCRNGLLDTSYSS